VTWRVWGKAADGDAGRFMGRLTDLPLDEVEEWEKLEGADINGAKIELAVRATGMLHGNTEALAAAVTAKLAFSDGVTSAGLPTVELASAEVIGAMIAAVATKAGLTASNGEARRLAQGGGLRLNDEAITDGTQLIEAGDVKDGVIKLAAGKKKIVLVKPV